MTDREALDTLPEHVRAEVLNLYEQHRIASLALTSCVHKLGGRLMLTDADLRAAHGRSYWVAQYPDGQWEVRTSTETYSVE